MFRLGARIRHVLWCGSEIPRFINLITEQQHCADAYTYQKINLSITPHGTTATPIQSVPTELQNSHVGLL